MRGIPVLVLLLSVITSSSYAQVAVGSSNAPRVLKVFDAQGKPVGPLDTYQSAEGVYLKFGHAAAFMPVRHKKVPDTSQFSESQFEWNDDTFATFQSSDCSGAPLIMMGTSPRPVELVRTGTDVTAYIAGPGYGSPLVSHSSISYDGSCTALNRSVPSYWVPQTTFGLTQRYPEPLTIHY
jgi:hypothetical protein